MSISVEEFMRQFPKQIRNPSRYLQGSMLFNWRWSGLLARKIVPSNIDFIVESNGNVLFAEFKSNAKEWIEVDRAQLSIHKTLVILGMGYISSVLVTHKAPKDQLWIDTIHDVISFQVMEWSKEKNSVVYSATRGKEEWVPFVQSIVGNNHNA